VKNENVTGWAVVARKRAARLQTESRRLRGLSQALRAARAGRLALTRCAWCGRVKIDEEWLQLAAIGAGQINATSSLRLRATHGICPPCFEREQSEAERARAARTA
jgi:hypothetical protein